MASPVQVKAPIAGQQLTQQAAQAWLADQMTGQLNQAWSQVDMSNLDATLPVFQQTVNAIVQQYGPASYALAAQYYALERRAAGISGSYVPPAPTMPDADKVNAGVQWATKGLWSNDPQYQAENLKAAQTNVQGVAENLVLGVGRDTTMTATKNDRQARAYAREVEPGACAFCLMLATRGAVYKSNTVNFRSHPHCRCVPVPVFGQYEPTAEVRQAQQMYQQAKSEPGATLGNFRRILDSSRQPQEG